jgi:raffinose/stachyose/melibiose transport system substrate-binding protein
MLDIWYPWTDKNELYEKAFLWAVQEYNQEHSDVQMNPKGMEMEVYREKLPSDIASNDTPDIYLCFTNEYLKNIADSGRVLNLNDYLAWDLDQNLQMSSLQNMTFDGMIYGLPFSESVGVFLVNTELFEQYGCEIPESWEQLLEVCRVFLENGITPLACSEDSDSGFRMYLEAICMNEAGAKTCEDIITGKQEVNEEFLQGVQKFAELMDMGAFGTIPLQMDTVDVEELFYLSRIPMYYTKSSFVGNIIQRNNPLYGKIHVIPFPGKRDMEMLGGVSECFVINADVEEPQEAVSALEEILQNFSLALYKNGSGIPVWNTEEVLSDREPYTETVTMIQNADSLMPLWEFLISGEKMENFMKQSKDLVQNKITWEEFVRGFN